MTVTGVEVSPDLRHARVFVSIMGSESERQSTLDGLDSIAHHLKTRIGRSLRLRVAPEIVFQVDETVARAARIESLLAQIKSGTPQPGDDEADRS